MNTNDKKMKTYTVVYSTSGEKWTGIREFAKINGLNTKNIDSMIERIKEVGDASLERDCSMTITDLYDHFDSIYNSMRHPCPHCKEYVRCGTCPMYGNALYGCCMEWEAVKTEILNSLDLFEEVDQS